MAAWLFVFLRFRRAVVVVEEDRAVSESDEAFCRDEDGRDGCAAASAMISGIVGVLGGAPRGNQWGIICLIGS